MIAPLFFIGVIGNNKVASGERLLATFFHVVFLQMISNVVTTVIVFLCTFAVI